MLLAEAVVYTVTAQHYLLAVRQVPSVFDTQPNDASRWLMGDRSRDGIEIYGRHIDRPEVVRPSTDRAARCNTSPYPA